MEDNVIEKETSNDISKDMGQEIIEVVETNVSTEEKLAKKYLILKDKLLENYEIGRKKYKSGKIIIAVLFIVLSVMLAIFSITTGLHMQMLTAWICVIFILVTIFLFLDYIMHLIEDNVIPYLKDDNMIEYNEHDIMEENDDEETAEEDEE